MVAKEHLQGRLADYIQANGLKNTRQRQVILECFLQANEHVSLDVLLGMVQERMPGVGYATVYRTMKLFTEAGIAHERRFMNGLNQYEPVDLVNDHHDHLICEECGGIFEFEDKLIERRQAEVAKKFGLRLTRHRLEMWGRCIDPGACEHLKRTEQGQVQ
jgi:Fur family ferric uptake transcriptional regulator